MQNQMTVEKSEDPGILYIAGYGRSGSTLLDSLLNDHPSIFGGGEMMWLFQQAAENGTSFGAPTGLETELAKMVCSAMPSIEMVRFVSSGTEAAMSALRLARAFTGRDMIIKFEGSYHGHSDGLLAQAGSGVATLGIPGSPGVPPGYAANTLTTPYNDAGAVEKLFKLHPRDIAAVIVEPVAANM